jgi:polysaccharide biosynthesis transport protein
MQQRQPTPPPAGINLSDIYYVLFRRKWLILFFTILGFAGAGAAYVKMPQPYMSTAQLMVKYVSDSARTVAVGPNADTVRQADARGEGIIASEAAMLGSYDVAKEVAETLGAKKILGPDVVETNVATVAALLQKNLIVDVPKRGNVLTVAYKSADPMTVQPVLQEVIKAYYKKHTAVHRDQSENSFFTERMTTLRGELSQAEDELRKAKAKASILSMDETKRFFSEQRSKLNDEISKAKTELAEKQASLQGWMKLYPNALDKPVASAATNDSAVVAAETKPAPRPPIDKIDEYKRLLERLAVFRKKNDDLRQIYTSEAVLVKENMVSITELEGQKKKMEEDFPGLLEQEQRIIARSPERSVVNSGAEFVAAESVRVNALIARIQELNAQQLTLNKEIEQVDGLEATIADWQRKKDEAESRIKVYSAGIEQDLVNQALASGNNMSNIKPIQEPTPPARDTSKVLKAMGGAAGGGLGLGLALAFLLELILNQTVRRASEIPGKFRLPVFINIPEFNKFGRGGRALKALPNAPIVDAAINGDEAPAPNGNGHAAAPANGSLTLARRMPELPPWDEKHDLYPFSEALRDRLVTFFEVKGMTHKPKLIAMTSCNHGAGVTTVAAGLAASLSETGEGNVLLVDMNMDQGAAHPFYRGKPACGLEELLMGDNKQQKREEAMVQDKLFVVSGTETDQRLPKILPKRFTHLLPKLQSSEYDYIIFDMPPMSQTSVTPRLAALMDVVLMVVESGKTHRDVLQHANAMLQETKTNVGVVFNRQRTYVPRALHQEL